MMHLHLSFEPMLQCVYVVGQKLNSSVDDKWWACVAISYHLSAVLSACVNVFREKFLVVVLALNYCIIWQQTVDDVMMMSHSDVQDETGVAAFTALPRSKWAEIRDRLKQNETNKRSLRLIDSSAAILVLDTSQKDKEADCNVCRR